MTLLPDYPVLKTDPMKDIATVTNITTAIQQIDVLSRSMLPTNITDEAENNELRRAARQGQVTYASRWMRDGLKPGS
ncbi:MAG: hypothetical protein BMS9Abin06_0420 [Gammaproteobacteria bacterium]|nr:MAG: hypothetical protein BMS9Abin06_0420 [Gammaproteobacteria bacterium]